MKIKLPSLLYILMATVFVFGALLTRGGTTAGAQRPENPSNDHANGGIATLYMMDQLASGFCFEDGQPGLVLLKNQVFAHCGDIESSYYRGDFTLGLAGRQVAAIVDLGTPADLARRYGFEETGESGQGFASLQADAGKILVLKDYHAQSLQDLKESIQLFQEGKPAARAPIRLGHIYLARLTNPRYKDYETIAKFMVIAYTPDQSVTIRWQLLCSTKAENAVPCRS
jgi:hypothetical protein